MKLLRQIFCVLAFWLAFGPGSVAAQAPYPEANTPVAVRVDIQDDTVRIYAESLVQASMREVWDVLTDFENLSRFVSNIASSKLLSRNGNVLRIAQTGKVGFGPFTFEFQSTRDMTLTPIEKFESRMVEGNMKRYHGATRLEAAGEGTTRILFQSEGVPDTILPLGLMRSTIESETREHYLEIAREVLRRKAAAAAR